jgi:phosphinothricin acetyltransferase
MSTPHLRPLQIGDQQKLIPLFRVLTGKEILIDAKSLVNDDKAICLVIEQDNELLGFGSLILHSVPTKGEVARIEDIVIDENQQGKGLGRMLVTKLIEIAREKKVSKISLTSNPMRVNAQKLYESVGFVRVNTDTFSITF